MDCCVIALEGNIGCQKHVLYRFLKKHFENINMIGFNGQHRHAMPIQLFAQLENTSFLVLMQSLLEHHERRKAIKANSKNLILTNRSSLSLDCFASAFYDMNVLSSDEYNTFQTMKKSFKFPKVDKIIYLNSDVNQCYERLLEHIPNVNFDFIQQLNQKYIEWLTHQENVILLDMEKLSDIETNEKSQHKVLKQCEFLVPYRKKYKHDEWTTVMKKSKKKRKKQLRFYKQ